ncbi:MAG: hypothetical protein AB7N80_11670 [Bdellovibrionales bacterium]
MKLLTLLIGATLFCAGCDLSPNKGGFNAAAGGGIPPLPEPGPACVTATVQWTPPTVMESGDPIPAGLLSGYRIYMGTSPGVYTEEFVVGGADTQTYLVNNLSKNLPYYFAMKSTGTDGSMSKYTGEVRFVGDVCKAFKLSFGRPVEQETPTTAL